MRVRYSLALLVLGLRAALRGGCGGLAGEGASATEMYFRGGCRAFLDRRQSVWATPDSSRSTSPTTRSYL